MALINNISELDELITISSQGSSDTETDEFGNPIASEGISFQTWAQVRSYYLSQLLTAGMDTAKGQTTFIIRFDQPKTIEYKNTITWHDKTFNIVNISPDYANRDWTTIIAEDSAFDVNKEQ